MTKSDLRLLLGMLIFLGMLSAFIAVKRTSNRVEPKVAAPVIPPPVEARREPRPEPESNNPFEALPDGPFPSQAKQGEEKRQSTDSDIKVELSITAADIKPRGLSPIPDDPPPHEGAMITIPYMGSTEV